jgi:hypothetical protein
VIGNLVKGGIKVQGDSGYMDLTGLFLKRGQGDQISPGGGSRRWRTCSGIKDDGMSCVWVFYKPIWQGSLLLLILDYSRNYTFGYRRFKI